MNNGVSKDKIRILGELIKEEAGPITFTTLEVGAAPLNDVAEPFYQLLDIFPGSKIIAFEVEEGLCNELNKNAKDGVKYYPVALGIKEEVRPF